MTAKTAQSVDSQDPRLRMSRVLLAIGLVGVLLVIAGAIWDRQRAFEGWLIAFFYWWSIAVGGLTLLALNHLSGGAWGTALRREFESASRGLAVVAVYFLPVVFGIKLLYDWSQAEVHQGLPETRAAWLTITPFIVRAIIYFVIWGGLTYLFVRRGEDSSGSGRQDPVRRARTGAVGMIVLVLAVSFAAVDWVMSLDSHWYSTGFGAYILVGCTLAGMAFALLVIGFDPCGRQMLLDEPYQLRRDLGNMLLVWVIVWAYLAFVQYLIIWSGNLEDDAGWFIERTSGIWRLVGAGLILFHFGVPFVILLSNRLKEEPKALGVLAAFVLVAHFLEVLWIIVPSFERDGFPLRWLDFVAPLAAGALWCSLFLRDLARRPRYIPQLSPHEHDATEARTS